MRLQPIVCAMALMLAACSTSRPAHIPPCGIIGILEDLVENEKRFSETTGQAYVVLATDTVLPEGTTETFTFQQVDLTSSTFQPVFVNVSFTSRTDTGDNFHRPASMAATSMRFAGKRAAPGHYALVAVSNKSLGKPTQCYVEGAPLYRFQEGAISIVQQAASSDAAPTACRAAIAAFNRDPVMIQAQVTEVLAAYPEMNAPLVVAPLLGTARCEPQIPRPVDSPCGANDRFSFAAAPPSVPPGRFAILPEAEALTLVHQCSRSAPKIDGTWPMTDSDAALLERELPTLRQQTATGCCSQGERIQEIDSYLRQYVGVTIDGRRYIYINGFASDLLDNWPSRLDVPRWQTTSFTGCDGGSAFWGALYDPVTRRFSDLAINGSA